MAGGGNGGAAARAKAQGHVRKTIPEIESMLEQLKIENGWSTNQLKNEVHDRGICLANGKEYGKGLRHVLAKFPVLVVGKKAVKDYPLARKCRVKVPEQEL
jgi:hypothetical protein